MGIETSPDGEASVLINSSGRLLCTAPNTDEAVTSEEGTVPEEKDGVGQAAGDLETDSDGQWRRFYHILECNTDPDEIQQVEEGSGPEAGSTEDQPALQAMT